MRVERDKARWDAIGGAKLRDHRRLVECGQVHVQPEATPQFKVRHRLIDEDRDIADGPATREEDSSLMAQICDGPPLVADVDAVTEFSKTVTAISPAIMP